MKPQFLIFCMSFALLSACSFGGRSSSDLPVVERGSFKVSVREGSREVNDFETPLVHRIGLSRADINKILPTGSNTMKLPFKGRPLKDARGNISGVRLYRRESGPRLKGSKFLLGLKENDLVTAVGVKHVKSYADLRMLLEMLLKEQHISVTLEREGSPHKIFYYLKEVPQTLQKNTSSET